MPLSWNEIRHRAIAFSKDWAGERREQAEKQTFWWRNGFRRLLSLSSVCWTWRQRQGPPDPRALYEKLTAPLIAPAKKARRKPPKTPVQPLAP